MQFITYPQQQPALAGNPGIAHAQVYEKQPVFDVQPIGPTNAYGQHGPNKRPQLSPLSEFYYRHGLTVGCLLVWGEFIIHATIGPLTTVVLLIIYHAVISIY